jgi:hypothetical protein
MSRNEQGIIPTTGCHHHWVIETPNGVRSHGLCKLCHESREFNNYFAESAPVRKAMTRSLHPEIALY